MPVTVDLGDGNFALLEPELYDADRSLLEDGPQALGVATYTTPAGRWGWTCGDCHAESRYVYGDRATAERLGRRHLERCARRPRPTPSAGQAREA
jgi:hypothetical protein